MPINWGDVITDTLLAAFVTAIATVTAGYFVLKSKGLFAKQQKQSLDATTMEKYDTLMNQQLEREQELRDQMAKSELRHTKELADIRIAHSAELAKFADRISVLEEAIHGDYELKVRFSTLPDPVVKDTELRLIIGKKANEQPPANPA